MNIQPPGIAVVTADRYALVAGNRWPAAVSPAPGELLSSWLHRLGHANGVPPRYFGAFLGATAKNWSARLDRDLPEPVLSLLTKHARGRREEIKGLVLMPDPLAKLRLPLRPMPRSGRASAAQVFWLQFCPACLLEDEHPDFRRTWTLATRVSCLRHGCRLRDRCPSCGCGIAPFRQDRLVPQQICAFCGADLCKRTRPAGLAVRRIEQLIDDLLRLHVAGYRTVAKQSVPDLLGASCFPSEGKVRPIMRLSLQDRCRLFRDLTEGVVPGQRGHRSAAMLYWAQIVRAARSHQGLVTSFADGILSRYGQEAAPPILHVDLPDLQQAMARLDQSRIIIKLPRPQVEIGRGSSEQTCPVHALEQWLHFAKIDFGPLFCRTIRDNKRTLDTRLSDKHVARLIKQTVLDAGIRSDLPEKERLALFSGHSLRAGLASSAEVDERYVQKQLGHASAEMTRRYQRRRDRFRVNLSKAAGL